MSSCTIGKQKGRVLGIDLLGIRASREDTVLKRLCTGTLYDMWPRGKLAHALEDTVK